MTLFLSPSFCNKREDNVNILVAKEETLKICNTCHKLKPLSKMYRPNKRCLCKQCRNLVRKSNYNNDKQKQREKQRLYYKNKGFLTRGRYRKNNKDKFKSYMTQYLEKNKTKISGQKKINNEKNKSHYSEQHKLWLRTNHNHVLKHANDRYKNDIEYRLKHCMRMRIKTAVNKIKIGSISKQLLIFIGCSLTDLKIHLEKQFQPGMSWGNYGIKNDQWSIDHIKPCSLFDHTNIEEIKKCHNFTNLRPMWHSDNVKKSNRISGPVYAESWPSASSL